MHNKINKIAAKGKSKKSFPFIVLSLFFAFFIINLSVQAAAGITYCLKKEFLHKNLAEHARFPGKYAEKGESKEGKESKKKEVDFYLLSRIFLFVDNLNFKIQNYPYSVVLSLLTSHIFILNRNLRI